MPRDEAETGALCGRAQPFLMSSIKSLYKKGLSAEEIAYIQGTDVGDIRLKLKALAQETVSDDVLNLPDDKLVHKEYADWADDVAEDDYSEDSRP